MRPGRGEAGAPRSLGGPVGGAGQGLGEPRASSCSKPLTGLSLSPFIPPMSSFIPSKIDIFSIDLHWVVIAFMTL